VFHQGKEPFVTASGGRMDEIIRAVRDCPSGALSYAVDGSERELPEREVPRHVTEFRWLRDLREDLRRR
jgi:Divergent 4Fe-4S mono-cluster